VSLSTLPLPLKRLAALLLTAAKVELIVFALPKASRALAKVLRPCALACARFRLRLFLGVALASVSVVVVPVLTVLAIDSRCLLGLTKTAPTQSTEASVACSHGTFVC